MVQARGAILSIQSQVAYGHVGNSAAVLPLQRLGFDVLPLNTVQLAHHPGYGAWRGHKLRPEQLLRRFPSTPARCAISGAARSWSISPTRRARSAFLPACRRRT